MISAGYCQTMARYNRWQNGVHLAAADRLSPGELTRDRGAFFTSIQGTIAHLLWGDMMWMSRFDGWEKPVVGLPESPGWIAQWLRLKAQRLEADGRIVNWVDGLRAPDLEGKLSWWSHGLGRQVTKPFSLCVVHFFNHQTHHRGQVHAMLTAAGAYPGDTDLFIMDDDSRQKPLQDASHTVG